MAPKATKTTKKKVTKKPVKKVITKRVKSDTPKFDAAFRLVEDAVDALMDLQEVIADARDRVSDADNVNDQELEDIRLDAAEYPVDEAYEVINDLHSYFMDLSSTRYKRTMKQTVDAVYNIRPPRYIIN